MRRSSERQKPPGARAAPPAAGRAQQQAAARPDYNLEGGGHERQRAGKGSPGLKAFLPQHSQQLQRQLPVKSGARPLNLDQEKSGEALNGINQSRVLAARTPCGDSGFPLTCLKRRDLNGTTRTLVMERACSSEAASLGLHWESEARGTGPAPAAAWDTLGRRAKQSTALRALGCRKDTAQSSAGTATAPGRLQVTRCQNTASSSCSSVKMTSKTWTAAPHLNLLPQILFQLDKQLSLAGSRSRVGQAEAGS